MHSSSPVFPPHVRTIYPAPTRRTTDKCHASVMSFCTFVTLKVDVLLLQTHTGVQPCPSLAGALCSVHPPSPPRTFSPSPPASRPTRPPNPTAPAHSANGSTMTTDSPPTATPAT